MRRGKLVIAGDPAAYRDDSIRLRISCAVFFSGIKNFFLAPASLIVPEIILTPIVAGGTTDILARFVAQSLEKHSAFAASGLAARNKFERHRANETSPGTAMKERDNVGIQRRVCARLLRRHGLTMSEAACPCDFRFRRWAVRARCGYAG